MTEYAGALKHVIDSVTGKRIHICGFLHEGRDGVVLKGHFDESKTDLLAVKFFLRKRSNPLFSGRTRVEEFSVDLDEARKGELERLASLSHPNVQQYITHGKTAYKKNYFPNFDADVNVGENIPFLVSRLIDGENLEDMLVGAKVQVSAQQLIRWLSDISIALEFIHQQDVLHNDVAMRNIVISRLTDRATLVDFGISKYLPPTDTSITRLWIDPDPLPQQIRATIAQRRDGKWTRQELRGLLFPASDLYCFAGVINDCLASFPREHISDFQYDYLKLISCELQKWELQSKNPPNAPFMADDLVKAFSRINSGADFYKRDLPKGHRGPRHFNRPEMNVEVREPLERILDHPVVTRLRNLSQLSLLDHIYPSASQKRLDHCIGVLGRTQQVWSALATRPRFRFLVEPDDIHRLEIIALLHDLNHFPFLHYFQEAGVEAVETAKVLASFLELKFPTTTRTLSDLLTSQGLSKDFISKVIQGDAGQGAHPVDDIILSIVNSGVDVDKMTYLYDDALHTGVPYGRGVDFGRIIQEMDVAYVAPTHFSSKRGRWHIVFHESALSAIESLCWARYWNFQRIYWHPRNRAVAAMIVWVVRELFATGKETFDGYLLSTIRGGELTALDYLDEKFKTHYGRASPLSGLAVDNAKVYSAILEIPKVSIAGVTGAGIPDARRLAAQEKVADAVIEYVMSRANVKLDPPPDRAEALLDIPIRSLGLGGPIFMLDRKGEPKPIFEFSPALQNLEQRFAELSSTLRVFVSPRIRDAVGTRQWGQDEEKLSEIVVNAAKQGAVPHVGEVK